MKTSIALLSLLTPLLSTGQEFDPDRILVGDRERPKVLLLGTFHFAYPGLDAHVTDRSKQVDVLADQRQRELNELIDVIMRFKPNKLCVETKGAWLWHEYQEYKAGKPLARNERQQLGFRIMDLAGMDTLYAVDERPLVLDLLDGPDSSLHKPWIDRLYEGWDWGGDDLLTQLYDSLYEAHDDYEAGHTLLENFLAMNDPHVLDRAFGAYLNGGFLLGEHAGADILSIHWYDRNLRIYRNIKRVASSPEDRVLVLFGAGHMGILKHLATCDPYFEPVTLHQLAGK